MRTSKIVVLDGYTLNPGDLDWTPLSRFGKCKVYDRTPPELILERAAEAEILFTNKTVLNGSVLSQLPKVKYIGVLATGYNIVDIEYTRANNIIVTNVPGYGAPSVAQAVFALLLSHTNRVAIHAQSVKEGDWSKSEDFCYLKAPLFELSGKVMGVFGYGSIGRQVVRLAQAFGMKVLVHTRTVPKTPVEGVTFVDQNAVFKEADVISLHCPLTDETENMINKETLRLMKTSAILINTSRGPLIDEAALAEALLNEEIFGAALDVLSVEPPESSNPLFAAPNCTITPHIAWATKEARSRLLAIAIENIEAYAAGKPINTVS